MPNKILSLPLAVLFFLLSPTKTTQALPTLHSRSHCFLQNSLYHSSCKFVPTPGVLIRVLNLIYQESEHKSINSCVSSVQFSCSVVSDSLRPHESQHARPPCPSSSSGVHSDSRPSSPWCHPAISSSVVPFCSFPQFLPASESFPMSQLFAWGGQSAGSFSFSIIPSKEIPGLISFRMDWLGLLAVQGTLKSFKQHHSSKASILRHSAFFTVQLSHPYMITGKTKGK